MLVLLSARCPPDQAERVVSVLEGLGHRPTRLELGGGREAVRIDATLDLAAAAMVADLAGVEAVAPLSRPVDLVLRRRQAAGTVVPLGRHRVGDGGFTIIAGPCAVESGERLADIARTVAEAGADALRGGAYKPRTSPYDFQGLGPPGLELLGRVREATGLPVITEAVDEASLELIERHADVIQIGARNMQNYALLKRAGRASLPVLLKRGMSATLEDLLQSAEYVLEAGNPAVILCERGIRTFSDHSRYTLDLGIVPVLKRLTHLPVIVDPSHATGAAELVAPLARAALAAGADGVMVEVHPDPAAALCDGRQSLRPEAFRALVDELRTLARLVARRREPVP